MNTKPASARKVDELLSRYSEFHRNPTNKAIHWVCVPLIVWSALGMVWAVLGACLLIGLLKAIRVMA